MATNRKELERDYLRYSTIGIEFALSIGVLAFAGWKLDQVLGLADRFPLFLVLGVFAGMGFGIYRMTRQLASLTGRGGASAGERPDGERPGEDREQGEQEQGE